MIRNHANDTDVLLHTQPMYTLSFEQHVTYFNLIEPHVI
jgi:hypothetical protein